MVNILFWVFAVIAIAGSVLATTLRQPVHCALSLVTTLFALSVMYLLLSAEFLFAVQIFIYAGGIMVLYLFVIFLVEPLRGQEIATEPRMHRLVGPAVVLVFSPVLIYALSGIKIAPRHEVKAPQSVAPIKLEEVLQLGPRGASDPAVRKAIVGANDPSFRDIGNTKVFGLKLFTKYLFPFEIVSVVLLVAMLGAIVLGRKRFSSYSEEEEAQMLAEAHYHTSRIAPFSGETAAEILAELRSDDERQHKGPGSDFKVVPDYEE